MMDEKYITLNQLRALFKYLMYNDESSFRYLIYDVMGFKREDYSDLYATGLMEFKDYIYELKRGDKKNQVGEVPMITNKELEHIANQIVDGHQSGTIIVNERKINWFLQITEEEA
jgi:hypothetical protein